MRCKACDVRLTNRESTRRSVHSGDYLDLCNQCYRPIQQEVPTSENPEWADDNDDPDPQVS